MKLLQVEIFDLENEKDIQLLEGKIELHKTYLLHRLMYYSQTPTDSDVLGKSWQDSYKNYELRIKRNSFVSIEKRWMDNTDTWRIELESNGYPDTVILYFKDEDKMQVVYNILFKYIFKQSIFDYLWL